MRSTEFVAAVRSFVMDAAVLDAVSAVQYPPGRDPDETLIRVHTWFERLAEAERDWVLAMMVMVARNAVAGFLSVLDGEQSLSASNHSGHFELRYRRDGVVYLLAGPQCAPLRKLL